MYGLKRRVVSIFITCHVRNICIIYRVLYIIHSMVLDSRSILSNCSDGDVRLVGGTSSNEGRVEICINQAWGSICYSTYRYTWRNTWNINEGKVVCRHLGQQPLGRL